jgi:hypothetical protein
MILQSINGWLKKAYSIRPKFFEKNSKLFGLENLSINTLTNTQNAIANNEIFAMNYTSAAFALQQSFIDRVSAKQKSLQPSLTEVLYGNLYSTIFSTNRLGGIQVPQDVDNYLVAAKELIKNQTFSSTADLQYHIEQAYNRIYNPIPEPNFEGNIVSICYSKDRQAIFPIEKSYEKYINMFISLGLDTADTVKGNLVGVKGFNELLFNIASEQALPSSIHQAVIWPKGFRTERYKKALYYFYDERYVDNEIYEFVDRYLMPKVVKNDYSGQEIIPPHKFGPILFCGYSIGARMNALYITAFKQRLINQLKMSNKYADAYINRILRVNIGAVVNWQSIASNSLYTNQNSYLPFKTRLLEQDISLVTAISPALTFLSINDIGVLKSEHLMNAVYYNNLVAKKTASIFHRSPTSLTDYSETNLNQTSKITNEYLIVLGQGQVPAYFHDSSSKLHLNPLGHSLIHYFIGLKNSPLKELFELPQKFLLQSEKNDFNLSEASNLLSNSLPYQAKYKPTEADILQRENCVADYLLQQANLKTKSQNENPKKFLHL